MKPERTKICHFTTVHIRTDVRIFYKQCISLSKKNYDVHLVVADGLGSENISNISIHDIGKMPNRFLRILINPMIMLRMLLTLNCSIYQFHDPELLLIAFILKKIKKTKVVYDSHECYADRFLHKDYLPKVIRPLFSKAFRIFERNIGKKMDCVIVTTRYHAEILKSINSNLHIIYNYPIISEWTNKQRIETYGKDRTLCYIGSLTEDRGITNLINAINQVDCKLFLAGSYDPPSYRQTLMQLKGWSKVVECGYVNRNQASEIIGKSMIGVVLLLPKPNYLTSLSTKVFEYMAGGIACLVSDLPIYHDIVNENNCGICVNPTDLKQIAKYIDHLLDNPGVARQMGENGKEAILRYYNWESQVPILINIYEELLCR